MLKLKTFKIKNVPFPAVVFLPTCYQWPGIQHDHSRVKFGENIQVCNSYQIKGLGASYISPNKIRSEKHAKKKVKTKTALS